MNAEQKLQRIEHIVVLQLENRSFDHTLGYLAKPEHAIAGHDGELDTAVNGLSRDFTNSYGGRTFASAPLDEDVFDSHKLDPPHGDAEVRAQIADGAMTGFVSA